MSPLKKITKRKKNSSNLTSKIRFFYTFDAPPPSTEGGFLHLFLVGQEGWQHCAPTPLGWGSGGRQLWRRGGKTAIQDLITWWVHWKNTKQKNHSSNLTVKMQNFSNCNFSITGAQSRRSYILVTRFVVKEMSIMFLHKTQFFLNDLFSQIALFSIARARSCRSHQQLISLLIF